MSKLTDIQEQMTKHCPTCGDKLKKVNSYFGVNKYRCLNCGRFFRKDLRPRRILETLGV